MTDSLRAFLATQQLPSLKSLFSWVYWTAPDINPVSSVTVFGLALMLVLTIIAIIWRTRLKKANQTVPVYGPVIVGLTYLIVFMLIISLSYLFFRAQELAYFSSRSIILAGGLVVLLVLAGLIFYHSRVLGQRAAAYLEKERFFRYLPKKRK